MFETTNQCRNRDAIIIGSPNINAVDITTHFRRDTLWLQL